MTAIPVRMRARALVLLLVMVASVLAVVDPAHGADSGVVGSQRTRGELQAEAAGLQRIAQLRPDLTSTSDLTSTARFWTDGARGDAPDLPGSGAGFLGSYQKTLLDFTGGDGWTRAEAARIAAELVDTAWAGADSPLRDRRFSAVGVGVKRSVSGDDDFRLHTLLVHIVLRERASPGAVAYPMDGSLPPNEPAFADVRGNVFEGDIERLADSGITKGCGGHSFCPDDVVTRGQMAAFLTRALDLPAGRRGFADTRGHVFEADIRALAAAGITRGCGGSSFCPNDVVTRGQMAAFLNRAGLTK